MHRRRLARLGISVAQVRELIETAIGGQVVTTVPEGDRRTDVVVRLPREFTATVENLRDLPLATPAGERVLLREVADLDLVEGPAQISREDGKRRVVVEFNVVGRDIGGFVAEARAAHRRRGRAADRLLHRPGAVSSSSSSGRWPGCG